MKLHLHYYLKKLTTFLYSSVFLLLLSTSLVQAQGWEKHYPPDFPWKAFTPSVPVELTSTVDGGAVIAVVDFIYPDTFQLDDKTVKVIKVDKDGAVQWQNKYILNDTTFVNPWVNDIKKTLDGNYIVSGAFGEIGAQEDQFFAIKIDPSGNKLWHQLYTQPDRGFVDNNIAPTLDGGYLINSETKLTSSWGELYIKKVDSIGNEVWSNYYLQDVTQVKKIISNPDDTYTIAGWRHITNWDTIAGFLLCIDAQGNELWDNFYIGDPTTERWEIFDAVRTKDGGYVASGRGTTNPYSNLNELLLMKMDSVGVQQWAFRLPQFGTSIREETGVVEAKNGGYIVSFTDLGLNEAKAIKVDDSGNVEWIKSFPGGSFRDVSVSADGNYLFSGYTRFEAPTIIKLDEFGHIYGNFLSGNVKHDTNFNCFQDAGEPNLSNWMLEAKGSSSHYGITDSLGNYEIELDTGSYDLRLITPTPIWQSCTPIQTIQVNSKDTITTDYPVEAIANCVYLSVDISAPLLRRCFSSYYYVSYCNNGTINSPNTYVEVDLDPNLLFVSSTIPPATQNGNTYTFLLGDVNVNECDRFRITVIPDCNKTILGQAICAEAHIFPDTICGNTNPTWDGSITSLEVKCEPDSVRFTIENIGVDTVNILLDYLVIEDDLILRTGQYNLSSTADQIAVPSNGSTYRLFAEQAPGYLPEPYKPTIAIEGCGTNSSGGFSTGFITMFAESDATEQISVDCQEIIGSYDPNDKSAEPAGFGLDHYIEADVDLEYRIRFQNVGTDTAFTVVIRDTISEHLNVSTLLQGTSSHPYRLEILNGHVLKFTFDDIDLVDSTTNEPGSHGFVKFKISQDSSLALGTMIYNSAAIYFDYNAPVITNETFHKVGEEYVEVAVVNSAPEVEYPDLQINVQPNPFTDYADFILEDAPVGAKTFNLYDSMGRAVRTEDFSGDAVHRFYKEGLSAGIYFYKINYKGKLLTSGKLIATN